MATARWPAAKALFAGFDFEAHDIAAAVADRAPALATINGKRSHRSGCNVEWIRKLGRLASQRKTEQAVAILAT